MGNSRRCRGIGFRRDRNFVGGIRHRQPGIRRRGNTASRLHSNVRRQSRRTSDSRLCGSNTRSPNLRSLRTEVAECRCRGRHRVPHPDTNPPGMGARAHRRHRRSPGRLDGAHPDKKGPGMARTRPSRRQCRADSLSGKPDMLASPCTVAAVHTVSALEGKGCRMHRRSPSGLRAPALAWSWLSRGDVPPTSSAASRGRRALGRGAPGLRGFTQRQLCTVHRAETPKRAK